MSKVKQITSKSKEFRKATRIHFIPKKYHHEFFEELIRVRGIQGSFAFIKDEESTIRQAFPWSDSKMGGDYWSNVENELLEDAGITAADPEDLVSTPCSSSIKEDELRAIHSEIKNLLEILRKA